MNQLSLFRTSDPETSREAAATVEVARSQSIVMEAFRLYGRMDDRLLVNVIDGVISPSRARGARCELGRAGRLRHVGYTGRPRRRVWELCK